MVDYPSKSNIVRRVRHFDLALRDIYSQSHLSLSSEEINLFAKSDHSYSPKLQYNMKKPGFLDNSLKTKAVQGRGRAMFIPQEIVDQPLRRPMSERPPLPDLPYLKSLSIDPADSSDYPEFADFFSGKLLDSIVIYKAMERFLFKSSLGLVDLEKMMQFFSRRALVCPKNAPSICKYLYVFSQDPTIGSNLRKAFFGNLEKVYMERLGMRTREGPTKYRNFIKWIMAAAHHFRNLLFAPFNDLMLSLLELAQEISEFNDYEDYGLYVQLMLRFHYYTSLPCSDGTKVSVQVCNEHVAEVQKAREFVRPKIAKGGMSFEQSHWLMLLLEVTQSSPLMNKEITAYYQRILPGFNNLLPEALLIRLPRGHGRSQDLAHIKDFIVE